MNSSSTIAGLLASVATGLVVFAANAQAPADAGMTAWDRVIMESAFSRADTNEDGMLSKTEAFRLAAMADRFDALDSDHDGSLNLEEFAVGFAAPL
jgi:Ca2+-binding EF-hand superfamily protein